MSCKPLFLIFFLLGATSVLAYDPEGHVQIEKAAIDSLIRMAATGDRPDGQTIYNYLLQHGLLLDEDGINSGSPDFDLSRQFLSDRQIYHFMARAGDVIDALKNPTLEAQKRELMLRALPDILNMIYILMRETIEDPSGARRSGRGTYVLIHAIADSYAREHTIRNQKTGEIEVIKGWRMSRLFWPEETDLKDSVYADGTETLVFLHTRLGKADSKWQTGSGEFTEDARMAVLAVRDFLVALYEASIERSAADEIVTSYMKSYFKPAGGEDSQDKFLVDGRTIAISYADDYREYGANTVNFDRYPHFSHMLTLASDLEDYSVGFELGYRLTPKSASSSSALIQRLPYGVLLSVNENSSSFENTSFLRTLQVQLCLNVSLYLPFNDLILEPKVGYAATPFLHESDIHSALIYGAVISTNFGDDFTLFNDVSRTKRISFGYEFDSSRLPSRHNVILKIGFNSWQGRIIRSGIEERVTKEP